MGETELYVVDIFAQRRYTGNQLAVFHSEGRLAEEEMLALTRETNFSEATFIESGGPTDTTFAVRIFDPIEKIPFAGHPTLGTAYVLREFVCENRPTELVLDLGVGEIPVWVETGEAGTECLWMEQVTPTFGEALAAEHVREMLQLGAGNIDDRYPIQLVSTGLPTLIQIRAHTSAFRRGLSGHSTHSSVRFKPVIRVLMDATTPVRAVPEPQGMVDYGGSHGDDMGFDGVSLTAPQPSAGENERFARVSLVPAGCGLEPEGDDRPNPMVGFRRLQAEEEVNVPLTSLDALQRAAVDTEPYYARLIEPYGHVNLLIVSPESYDDHDLAVRVFADYGEVPEDPATGSSNGCLAGYLLQHGVVPGERLELTVEQGYELDRPSLLHLRSSYDGDELTVQVGGQVVPVYRGTMLA